MGGCASSAIIKADKTILEMQLPISAIVGDRQQSTRCATNACSTKASDPMNQGTEEFHRRYILLGKLGRGAFAEVHLAKSVVGSSKEVAVKIMNMQSVGADTEGSSAFIRRSAEREVQILARLGKQPQSVGLVEAFLQSQFVYIVMERCEATLKQAMDCMPEINERTLAPLIRGMVCALDGIHGRDVVHRDVKPDNFLCSGERMTIKLCDFGMASLLSRRKPYLQGVFGTAPFMSPEMLAGLPYGCGTDIWSLGVLAYTFLSGAFPYRPVVDTSKGMKAAIFIGKPEPTFQGPPGLVTTPDASSLLQSLLCRDPKHRPFADDVLKLPWLQENNPRLANVPSLKKVFRSAQCAGAFDMRPIEEASPSNMECRLAALQAKHHPGSSTCAEEDAGSCERRLGSGKGYVLPARVEDHGGVPKRMVSPGTESLMSQLSTVATLEYASSSHRVLSPCKGYLLPSKAGDKGLFRRKSKSSSGGESLQSQFSPSVATAPEFDSLQSATGPNPEGQEGGMLDNIVHEMI